MDVQLNLKIIMNSLTLPMINPVTEVNCNTCTYTGKHLL